MIKNRGHIVQLNIHKSNKDDLNREKDWIAVELPLEIRLKREMDPMSKALAVTMRTPGNDEELAAGFLFTEAIIRHKEAIISFHKKGENSLEIELSNDTLLDLKNADRNFYTTSSCGVCGKASIEAIKVSPDYSNKSTFSLSREQILKLPHLMSDKQSAFNLTGGIHAAALFDLEGRIIHLSEDVGRHNALDKLIGAQFLTRAMPLDRQILLLSGRISFELVQKAAMAGISVIVAFGAPSSLAIELAEEHSITLIGFLKKDHFNIYTAYERIIG